jgi:5'-nucleotidase
MGPLIGSGTIGACWQGAINGIPAIAFSAEVRSGDWRDKENWVDEKIAIPTIEKIIKLLKPKLKPFHFFNVNLPLNLTEKSEIIFNQKIQRKRYNTRVEKRIDPESRPYYWTMGEKIKSDEEGKTDFEELLDGKIVITEISLDMFVKK